MKTKGQVGYEAYCSDCGGYSHVTGDQLPHWDLLDDDIKGSWEAAARAIVPAISFGEEDKVYTDSVLETYYKCPVCADDRLTADHLFCPHCGARVVFKDANKTRK